MTSDPTPGRKQGSRSGLFEIHTGEVLGKLPRGIAERGYHLYQDRRVAKITDIEQRYLRSGAET